MVIGIFCSDTDTDTVFVQLNQFSQILSRQCCLLFTAICFSGSWLQNKNSKIAGGNIPGQLVGDKRAGKGGSSVNFGERRWGFNNRFLLRYQNSDRNHKPHFSGSMIKNIIEK